MFFSLISPRRYLMERKNLGLGGRTSVPLSARKRSGSEVVRSPRDPRKRRYLLYCRHRNRRMRVDLSSHERLHERHCSNLSDYHVPVQDEIRQISLTISIESARRRITVLPNPCPRKPARLCKISRCLPRAGRPLSPSWHLRQSPERPVYPWKTPKGIAKNAPFVL